MKEISRNFLLACSVSGNASNYGLFTASWNSQYRFQLILLMDVDMTTYEEFKDKLKRKKESRHHKQMEQEQQEKEEKKIEAEEKREEEEEQVQRIINNE